jgi:hypothetical protein
MSEGQSQRSVASSVQHRQEAEVAAAEERERAAAETAATAARAASLTMAELAAARAEVEAAAAAAELEVLRASSTDSSISADDNRDNKLKLTRGAVGSHAPQTVAAAQTGVDEPAARLTEIAAFTGGAALPLRTGTMVTMGSRPLSGTSVQVADDLPSPRPTTSSGPR